MKRVKILSLLLSIIITAIFMTACAGEKPSEPEPKPDGEEAEISDLEYILEKGTLTVGITDYKPMNYLDENGEWTGFDTEFARLVADTIGVKVEFVLIEWNDKWDLLNNKSIDCVWNGMTLSSETEEKASCSDPYVRNSQVVVTSFEDAKTYTNADSLKDCAIAVEQMSAGMSAAKAAGLTFAQYPYQSDALNALANGVAEACIIDLTMARATTGEGNAYEDLTVAFALTGEEYAVACRKDSDLTGKINEIMKSLLEDETLVRLAKKYELTLCAELG